MLGCAQFPVMAGHSSHSWLAFNPVTGADLEVAKCTRCGAAAESAKGLARCTLPAAAVAPTSAPCAPDTKRDKLLVNVLNSVLKVLEEIGDKDGFDRISEPSLARKLTKEDYVQAYGVPVSDLACMVTGISQKTLVSAAPTCPIPKNTVTLTYLLPHCADAKERLFLDYKTADVESIRNSILLCKGIEEAFNQKFISFVPADDPFSNNRYKVHIWVDAVRSEPIYEGAAQTIGSYDGAILNLTVGAYQHNPFNRALSYQAFRAFKTWGKGFGLTELPEDSDTFVYNGAYKLKRAKYAKQLARDIEADAEDAAEAEEY